MMPGPARALPAGSHWDKNDDRAMKPLGSVNEVREKVYEASQDLRGANGAAAKKCPYGFA